MSGAQALPLLVMLMLCPTLARAEVDHAAIGKEALTNVIRPGYASFAGAATSLEASVGALCQAPSPASLADARTAFAKTVAAWSAVEPIRFGPVEQEHRHDRIFYWPDPKALGIKQVREALTKEDKTVTGAETLSAKSVALQGLPALEYLLYGNDADTLSGTDGKGAFRCAFAHGVAANLVGLSKEVTDGWADGAAYAKSYLAPAPDNSAYHAPKEVTLDLFKTFTGGIELVRDAKLAKTLGPSPEQARPKLAPFWRSGLFFANLTGNLQGARDLFLKGGFAGIVHGESAGVEDSIAFDLNYAVQTLSGIAQPVEQAVRDAETRAKIEALRVSLKSAAETASGMIAKGADLSFGFNAMDGD